MRCAGMRNEVADETDVEARQCHSAPKRPWAPLLRGIVGGGLAGPVYERTEIDDIHLFSGQSLNRDRRVEVHERRRHN